jgi:hypothetical protein
MDKPNWAFEFGEQYHKQIAKTREELSQARDARQELQKQQEQLMINLWTNTCDRLYAQLAKEEETNSRVFWTKSALDTFDGFVAARPELQPAPDLCKHAEPQKIHGVWANIPVAKRPDARSDVFGGGVRGQLNVVYNHLWNLEAHERQIKRTLREWPVCAMGGEIKIEWKNDGQWTKRPYFVCEKCSKTRGENLWTM